MDFAFQMRYTRSTMWLDYHDALSYQCNTVCATVIQTFLPQVQTGFGRLGSSYWGFEDAGVTPDIGKKIVLNIHLKIYIYCENNK